MDLSPRRKKAPPPFPVTNLLPRSDKELEITLKRLLNAPKVIAPSLQQATQSTSQSSNT
ncbi:hypothetical protein [Pseudovibrio ascidiaceicola]|uniref:hypothetical protein n=1 Tax=Pseudovibrio ascidiaceicola TaxID=285279 RepID=UPI00135660CA|nr:hypothetical protein [Pseudovibrio ascidiaceicola]